MHDLRVPFANNQAERAGLMMKVRMRNSRVFRSLQGAFDFATLRSVLPTVQKRGLKRITVVT